MPAESHLPMHTARLRLDALREEDAQDLFAYRSDPRIARYQGWRPDAVEDAAAFIARQSTRRFAEPDGWNQLAIRLRESGELIGDLGIHFPPSQQDAVELGISLMPAHQGSGYAREAMRAVIGHLFGEFGYRRIVGSVDPRNHASVALLHALGFRKEAHHVESLYFRGEWVDDLVFALLAREWSDQAVANDTR
ncbi:GNAT family N-acetyltransferase [Oleiagrimonas sp. MCCC 1A03011]|nr:GNAT family N-acetyltransferase [Oleiagrimonas sp. MCCC 1A03011]